MEKKHQYIIHFYNTSKIIIHFWYTNSALKLRTCEAKKRAFDLCSMMTYFNKNVALIV